MKTYTIQINHHIGRVNIECSGMEIQDSYVKFYDFKSDQSRKTVAIYSIRNIISVTVNNG